MDELCIEGWLHRSKKGDPTQRERRYFFSSGFAVEYCKTPDRASRTGKFDLRMVEELDEPEPGMLFVRVKGKTHPLHVFLPSPMEALQQGDGADAKAWRMLWASAVDESVVSLALESAPGAAPPPAGSYSALLTRVTSAVPPGARLGVATTRVSVHRKSRSAARRAIVISL